MNYTKELAFAKSLALEAGGVMRHYFRARDTHTSWKQENDPLTIADTTINSLVIERVRQEFATHGVLGEEEIYNAEADELWVIDPIDGTLPYILGMPTAVLMIALVKNGRPVVSVIYNPWMDLLYHAVKGSGAYRNGERLQITSSDTKIVELVLWKGSIYREIGEPIRAVLENTGFSPQNYVGGVAKTALLENHMYGYIYADDSPWDEAAFDLLVHEAGGILTDLDGNLITYKQSIKGAIAGSQETHPELLKMVKSV